MKLKAAINYGKLFLQRRPSMIICSIKLTSNCTQRCLQCSIPELSDGSFISLEDFEKILVGLKAYGTRKITLTGGEPAIHPHLEQIFAILHKHGFEGSNLLTNLYYPPEMQDHVIDLCFRYRIQINTSYDAVDEVADTLRGAKNVRETVERAMQKISNLNRSLGRPFKPTATVVISEMNIKQIPQIIHRIQELGWWMNIDVYRWASEFHKEDDALKIKDMKALEHTLQIVRNAPNLRTPLWIYDGTLAFLMGKQNKKCPYLISPTFGSKFFISDKGELQVCMGSAVGNLLTQSPKEILNSPVWKAKREEFAQCKGCWNTCYTLSSSIYQYVHYQSIRQLICKM